ncbi:unnamed protein product, partial [Clavelina lepadiformis]
MEKDADQGNKNIEICTVSQSVLSVAKVERENIQDTDGPVKLDRLCDLVVYNPKFNPQDSTSTWSLGSSTTSSGTPVIRWYRHPKVREHWKVVVASFVLFFIGL